MQHGQACSVLGGETCAGCEWGKEMEVHVSDPVSANIKKHQGSVLQTSRNNKAWQIEGPAGSQGHSHVESFSVCVA